MGDKLAVIQGQKTVDELKLIETAGKNVVKMFKDLVTQTNLVNRSLNTGKLREFNAALQDLNRTTQQHTTLERQLSSAFERTSRLEREQARLATEHARTRAELARAIVEESRARQQTRREAEAEAKANKNQQRQLDANTGAYKRLSQEANRVKQMTKNLEAEILLLTRDFKTGAISQEKYNQELAKLQGQFQGASKRAKELDAELKRIDANVGDRQRNVGNYRDAAVNSIKGLDGQIKSMVSMYLGFQAVITGGSKLIHNNYELSDSLADLQIRLNGNKEATDGLFDSLRKMDTRTGLGELVNTASIVAKKGVAVDEIEGITKALDDYFIVAGKEAGNREEGTASIIKLISIFNEDKHITAERVTEIGTALVKLQNSGVATGSKMIDVAERIGAVRGITGITLPQVLGFAAAIEQLGQKSEVAGTAGMQILTKILSDMPKYAKLAGISVEELRKIYNENPFEAVVKVSEGVLKTGDLEKISQDLEEVGVRGARVKGVLGDIAGNADFVRKRIKDANLAINEQGYLADTAGKKQETFAATLDKVKKEFELIGSNDGFRNFLDSTSKVVLGFIKIITAIPFGIVITGLTLFTAAWAYYKGMVIQATIANQWNNSQSLLGTIRNKAARLGLLGEAEAMRANTIQTEANTVVRSLNVASLEAQIAAERAAILSLQNKISWDEAENIVIRQQIVAKEALVVALEAEVAATNQATAATARLNVATKMSPLGIVLGVLAVVVPLMLIFSENTEKAAKKVRTLAENQKDLNSAMDKGVKNAAEEVAHLDELYKKYTNVNTPMKEKKEILKEWQDYYPSYFGSLRTEKDLNDKLSSSYKELRDSIVSAARADAIRDKLKGRTSERLSRDEQLNRDTQKETELNKKLRASSKTQNTVRRREDGGDGKSFVVEIQSTDLLLASDKRVKNLAIAKQNNDKADADEDKILLDMLVNEDKRTAKLRKDRAGRLGKFAKPEEEKKPKKEKEYSGAKLNGNQKDAVNDAQGARDNEIANLKKRKLDLELNQEEYWNEYEKVMSAYSEKVSALLNGNNAKERQIEGAARKRAVEALEQATKELYDIRSKRMEENFKKTSNALERQTKQIEEDQSLSDVQRLNKQISIDTDLISETENFYKTQIALAVKAGQDVLELERKRDDEIGKIQDERNKRTLSLSDAYSQMFQIQSNTVKFTTEVSVEEQKRLIMATKNLSIAEKTYQLSQLEKDALINANDLEIQRLKIEQGRIIAMKLIRALKGGSPAETAEETAKIAELQAQIDALLTGIEQTKGEKRDLEKNRWKEVADEGIEGLRSMGFNNLADTIGKNFDDLFEKISKGALTAKDAALVAAAAIADGLSSMIDTQKAHTIASLDEQLKYSQEAAEQETEFITGRLEQLNALEELTAEQMTERSRLEDEAMVVKEQQQQREKLIETQKAKAEQKAASQQALINGALGATQALASMPPPASFVMAGLALAFGIAQSVAIMSKDPTPKYWKGRKGGKAEFAWTQERGAEVITDKNDNIKSLGSGNGAKMTWLDAGDKVYTAVESKDILKTMGPNSKIGNRLIKKSIQQSLLAPVVNVSVSQPSKNDNKLESAVRKAFKDFGPTSIRKEKGLIIKEKPGYISKVVGTYDLKTQEETWI
ncbi:phage tail tape measure protein [Chryseobacterium vrystaatense]|uniref:Phage-related minor tail protein n=1 Tax=Chryseobacterium vrystaatense TaxID=307480 RepID=A0A1M4ZLW1_9FLAO|nr:phage tail tape measure protein [Chryseobacterium vrystaatense]SHF18792.1 Phage-related minor tail protein [Chryseobacterium vrystaatense]